MRLFIVSLMLIFVTCNNNGEVKRQYFPNGHLKSEIYYVNDTCKEGKATFYFETGTLKDEVYFKDNLRHGLHTTYTSNGVKESEIGFLKGKQNGLAKWFYPNGKVKSQSYWFDDIEYGSTFFFYPNGNLRTYQCKDFNGDPICVSKFSESGDIIFSEGNIFGKEYILAGDTIYFCVAERPFCKTFVKLTEGQKTFDGVVKNSLLKIGINRKQSEYNVFAVAESINDTGEVIVLRDTLTSVIRFH